MEVVHERCAGLDVSKRDVKVCVRSPGKRRGSYAKSVSTFGSVTAEILRLRDHLTAAGVSLVVLEATGHQPDTNRCKRAQVVLSWSVLGFYGPLAGVGLAALLWALVN